MLTGRQIAESGMLTGFEEKNIQQQGVDIRIAKVNKVKGKLGVVPETGKTILPDYEPIQPLHYKKIFCRYCGANQYKFYITPPIRV